MSFILSAWPPALWLATKLVPFHEGEGAALHDVWLRWNWPPAVILVLLVMAGTYSLGWWRLRRQGHHSLAGGWRLTAYLSGLGVLALALLSPIDTLQSLLFSVHMIQHELLMMIAPPLLLLANPFPIALWGMPASLRRAIGGMLHSKAIVRWGLQRLTAPWVAWVLYVGVLWLWHAPAAYDAALRNELIHDLEHITFFGTALLFWWHVVGAAPHIHGPMGFGARIGYVLAALAQNEVLAVGISLTDRVLYTYYETVPRLWGLSALQDQELGGAIMWIPGGMMYALTAIILLACLLNWEEKRTNREVSGEIRSLKYAR